MLHDSLTIVIATLNSEDHIRRCLGSVFRQKYVPRIILVDGGSTDLTLSIIRSYEAQNLTLISKPDCGIYHALNTALSLLQTDYYMVLGSDDMLYPSASELILTALNCCDSDVLFFNVGPRNAIYPSRSWMGAGNMVPGHSCGMVIAKAVHHIIGKYDVKYRIAADAMFIKKIFMNRVSWCHVDKNIAEFSDLGISNTNTICALSENFDVQIRTGESKLLQVILFVLRLFKNIQKL